MTGRVEHRPGAGIPDPIAAEASRMARAAMLQQVYVGEAHTDQPYPGDLAEEMTAHAAEQAFAAAIRYACDPPMNPGETRKIEIVIQCAETKGEGTVPTTVDITATARIEAGQ